MTAEYTGEERRSENLGSDWHVEDGVIVKRVTPLMIYQRLKVIEEIQRDHGEFLGHLDKRMDDYNGFRKEVLQLQEDITTYCNDRTESCPVLPLLRKVEGDLGEHLSDVERIAAISEATSTLREQIKREGMDEERNRFNRAMKIIGASATIIVTLTGFISWVLGLWG